MRHLPFSLGLREHRLLRKGYLADTWETYVARPWKEGGNVKRMLGPVAGAANVFWRGFDEALRAMSGQEYQAPVGIMGNTRRDLSKLFSNLGDGEFLKAASNAWSIVSGDVPADVVDMFGFRKKMQQRLSMLDATAPKSPAASLPPTKASRQPAEPDYVLKA